MVAGYGVLGVYMLLNPGALTGRFALISIWADGAPLGTVIDRFLVNYFSYFGAGFLFLSVTRTRGRTPRLAGCSSGWRRR